MSLSKRQFLGRLASQNKLIIAISICLGIFSSFFNGISTALIVPVMLSLLGDEVSPQKIPPALAVILSPFQDIPPSYKLLVMSLCIIAAIALKNMASYFNIIASGQLVRSISSVLRQQALEILLSVELYYLNNIQRGDIINRISAEIDRGLQSLRIWISIVTTFTTIIIFLFFLISLSWQLTLFLTLLFPLSVSLNQLLVKQSRTLGNEMTQANRNYASHLYEIFDGLKLVRSSGTETQELQQSIAYIKDRERILLDSERNNALFGPIAELTNISFLFILIWVSRFLLQGLTSDLTTILLSYLVILYRFLPFVGQLNGYRGALARSASALELIMDFLNHDNKPFTVSGLRSFPGIREGIRFNQVSFVYPGSQEKVLEEINLYVPRGSTLALVGASGSGKSTLADLLPRFYHPTSGRIEIDGCPIQEFDLRSLRKAIGIVSQDTFVFNQTLRYNIAYGQESVTEEQIIAAAKQANAYEFIKEFPDGLDTFIGNRGVRLSGGQRQRIAIARALIQNPEILILDEATSALDTVSERLVQAAIDELSSSRTTIVIAHRLSTIQNAEQIAVLEKGKVIEVGTHDELLLKKGAYSKLYSTQSKTSESLSALANTDWEKSITRASYDTRTSLNSVLGSLSLVAGELFDDEEEKNLLIQNAFQESLRLLEKLETLENFTKGYETLQRDHTDKITVPVNRQGIDRLQNDFSATPEIPV